MFFRDEFYVFSNMYTCPIKYEGITYPSAENLYQALKTLDDKERLMISTLKPVESKKQGRNLKMRTDWNSIKTSAMHLVISLKAHQCKEFREKLIATEGEIVEDNTWNDTFWGKCNGVGENHLGKILMQARDLLLYRDSQ